MTTPAIYLRMAMRTGYDVGIRSSARRAFADTLDAGAVVRKPGVEL
jgi:hypothetical protein